MGIAGYEPILRDPGAGRFDERPGGRSDHSQASVPPGNLFVQARSHPAVFGAGPHSLSTLETIAGNPIRLSR